MIPVEAITNLQKSTVELWHQNKPDPQVDGLLKLAMEQHRRNYNLWHEEDIARSPDVSDTEIARVKRSIDKLNQSRNDHIEQLDDAIIKRLVESGVNPEPGTPMNTETPGSAIDRLSIMALRIYHMTEQVNRTDATEEHKQKAAERLQRCFEQHADLSKSLEELLADLFAGRKFLKVYHQFKMYNDPTMNPYLYAKKST